ncbi:MAG: ATP-grasp domain-containing protein [Lachnospiraceae bacterium]|nr:ATP-grasp domain-containing protein [Lachnospiraceae bacterium]
MKKKLLITAGGTGSAWQIAEKVRLFYDDRIELYITDTNPEELVASSTLADHFIMVPPVKSKGYADQMYRILKSNCINAIIPLIPWEQSYFAMDLKQFASMGIKSAAPLVRTARTLNQKIKLHDYCNSCDIPTIPIIAPEDVKDNKTYFIKDKSGFGSMGARRIKGADIKRLDRKYFDKYVIQQDCTGLGSRAGVLEEVTAECFYDGFECHTIVRERLEAKSGVCTKARFRKEPQIEAVVNRFTELLPFPPVFNIQFVKRGDEWLVMDVNLRLAAGTGLSAAAGFDVVRALLAWILDDMVDPGWLEYDESVKTVLRVYKEITVR